jgi:hypothetical protein
VTPQGGFFDEATWTFQETGHGWWNDDPVAQALRDSSLGGGSHANLVAHTLKADGFDASEDGTGRGLPLVAQTVTSDMYRSGGAVAGNNDQGVRNCVVTAIHVNGTDVQEGNDNANTLSCGNSKQADTSRSYVAISHQEKSYEHATKTNTIEVLRALRFEIGEEAFSEWGLGVLASFFPSQILQSAVHGFGIRCQTIEEFGVVRYALPCAEDGAKRLVREMRETQRERRSSFGWEPHEQRTVELAAYLSWLSHPSASCKEVLRHLRAASEGIGLLRDALPAVQEMGRSEHGEGQSIHGSSEGLGGERAANLQSSSVWEAISREWLLWNACHAGQEGKTRYEVRRLTVRETELLQGFPRNYTAIPVKGKPAKDGPRYKSHGNSFAVNCIRLIGDRITRAISIQ